MEDGGRAAEVVSAGVQLGPDALLGAPGAAFLALQKALPAVRSALQEVLAQLPSRIDIETRADRAPTSGDKR